MCMYVYITVITHPAGAYNGRISVSIPGKCALISKSCNDQIA